MSLLNLNKQMTNSIKLKTHKLIKKKMSGYYKNSGLTFFYLMKDRQIFKRIHVLFLKTGPHRIMSTNGKMDDKMDGKMYLKGIKIDLIIILCRHKLPILQKKTSTVSSKLFFKVSFIISYHFQISVIKNKKYLE